DGNKAEQLVRFRRYIEGDVQRTRVQQDFVKALFEQKKDASYLLKAPELFQELSKSCKTNITLNILLKNINEINNMSQYDLETHKMPGEGTYVGDVSYFLPYLDESYPVFQNYFLGTGEPSSKKYTDMTGAKWPKGWSHNTKEETTSKKS
ncbi:MAG: hypothetical protein Q8924_19550, partial [Bacillota bacterium]|nr:hypothetical protein [Bacillota bacterium]